MHYGIDARINGLANSKRIHIERTTGLIRLTAYHYHHPEILDTYLYSLPVL